MGGEPDENSPSRADDADEDAPIEDATTDGLATDAWKHCQMDNHRHSVGVVVGTTTDDEDAALALAASHETVV